MDKSSNNSVIERAVMVDKSLETSCSPGSANNILNSESKNGDQLLIPPALTVKGIKIHSLPHLSALQIMDAHITAAGAPRHICITNTESMFHALKHRDFRQYISDATLSLCDGIGVVIAGRAGGKIIQRFTGPLLVKKSAEFGQNNGWRHFFCGGKNGVAEKMSENLKKSFPGMTIAGTYSPPFRELSESEEREMIDQINAAKPDIVWVGLGILKQEAWISRYKNRLVAPWLIGVGAAFDFHAGTAKWAPAWVRNLGLEWLYRLLHEPRMLKRNFYSFAFLTSGLVHEIKYRFFKK